MTTMTVGTMITIPPRKPCLALPVRTRAGLIQTPRRIGGSMRLTLIVLAMIVSLPHLALAHGGGLNKEGCHNNRKTGDYHCHRGGSSPRSAAAGGYLVQPLMASPGRPSNSRAFANCSEARAAGAAPVRRGDVGYASHLDRDNDGVGCEPYRGRR